MKPTLLVLAAGMGSRYGGLKQVDPVGPASEAIIEYSIFDAIRAGFGKVVFVIRKDIEAPFREQIGDKFTDKIEVAYAFQEMTSALPDGYTADHREKPWGTAHAVLVARDLIQEPFAVINADDYYGAQVYQDAADFLRQQCTPTDQGMIGYVLEKTLSDHGTVNRGVCETNADNHLTDIVERLKIAYKDNQASYLGDDGQRYPLDLDTPVSMNFWLFHPSIFDIYERDFHAFVKANPEAPKAEFFIPLTINRLVSNGELNVHVVPGKEQWYGVTYREDKPMVVKAFAELTAKGVYPSPLW